MDEKYATEQHHPHQVSDEPVTSVLTGQEVPVLADGYSADEEVLAALGYKSEFKREFSLWTTFCVSFAVLGLLPSFASTLAYGMGYAGLPGMTWGWIIAMFFIQCVALGMAELCSSMPTSGGLYYAAAVLAPKGYGPFAAWITGWSNWLGQVTAAPSVDYALAAMMLAAASITNPDFVPENWQVFLLTVALMVVHACISSMPTRWIAVFNSWGSTFNMAALFVVIVVILGANVRSALAADAGMPDVPKWNNNTAVWAEFYDGTDYPAGVAVLMTLIAPIWTMSGFDSSFHLAEECSNANIASPRSIVMTASIGGITGWVLQLAVAYTVVDVGAALSSDIGQPWAAYLSQVLDQKAALACLSLTIIAAFSMGQGCMVAASRVTFAYARDGCFPYSRYWARVNRHTRTPVNAVWFNAVIGCLLVLLLFAGNVAIGAIFSIGAIGCFVAFTIPITIRTFFVGKRFRPGPWNLGRASPVIGTLATAFTALMIPILCLPSVTGADLDPTGMNWTALCWGAPMLFATVWFAVDARKWFKGPKVNIEHMMNGPEREATVLEGKATREGDGSEEGDAVDVEKGSGKGERLA